MFGTTKEITGATAGSSAALNNLTGIRTAVTTPAATLVKSASMLLSLLTIKKAPRLYYKLYCLK